MATRTVTTYICDRCGHESESKSFADNNTYGYTKIEYKGHRGSKTWDGSWGGASHEGELTICDKCTNEFMQFIKKPEVNSDGKQ